MHPRYSCCEMRFVLQCYCKKIFGTPCLVFNKYIENNYFINCKFIYLSLGSFLMLYIGLISEVGNAMVDARLDINTFKT